MTLQIILTSEPKGSNPGGKGKTTIYGEEKEIYLKYCNISHIRHPTSFNAQHQPIYEAITFALAQKLGLIIPNYYILSNEKKDLRFSYNKGIKKLAEDKPYYLLSELVQLPINEDPLKVEQQMKREKIFRDILLISDISGKKQNFCYFEAPHPYMFYIDLGCSFVDSVGGILQQRQGKYIELSKKEYKASIKMLQKYSIMTRDYQNIFPLHEIIDTLEDIQIPTLNPSNYHTVKSILCEQEIEEIRNILLANLPHSIKRHKESEFLI